MKALLLLFVLGGLAQFHGTQSLRSFKFHLDFPVAKAFPMFEPEGERAWAPGWDPQFICPADKRAQVGAVFVQDKTTWTIVDYVKERRIRYVNFKPNKRLTEIEVAVAPTTANACNVTVNYRITPLSEEGAKSVKEMDATHFSHAAEEWKEAVSAALERER
jgi:hypothetical protein